MLGLAGVYFHCVWVSIWSSKHPQLISKPYWFHSHEHFGRMKAKIWHHTLVDAQFTMKYTKLPQIAVQEVVEWSHFRDLIPLFKAMIVRQMEEGFYLVLAITAHCL
jgi:hypothetical protein